MYAHFATEGPTEEEVAVARSQMVVALDDQLQRPDFWAWQLATTGDYRGREPREILAVRAQYERATAADVHETFRRYWRPETRFTIVVAPGTPTEPAPEPAGTPASTASPERGGG
jgi:hypothetical protein